MLIRRSQVRALVGEPTFKELGDQKHRTTRSAVVGSPEPRFLTALLTPQSRGLAMTPGPNSKPHPFLVPAIAASQFAPPFMISGVAVALPAMGADLAAGATALSLVETLFLAASVALLLPAGRLGDAADKVAGFKLGMLAFAATSILA